MNRKEKDEGRLPIIDIDGEARQIAIKNPDMPADQPKSFTFDGTFDENTQQKFFYEEACFDLIESVLQGFNGTIFAYGQTGYIFCLVSFSFHF
jgi:kinesin family protein 3/17